MSSITTDRQVRSIQPKAIRAEYAISGSPGLSLVVQPKGTRSFVLRYVAANGHRKRYLLGQYPGLGLADARQQAASLKVSVVNGGDPAALRSATRSAAKMGETLDQLAAAYWVAAAKGLHGGRGRPKRRSTIASERNRWDRHIQPALGDLRVADIHRRDIKAFMRALASHDHLSADTVASVGRTLSSILSFAVNEEHIEANPAAGLTRPLALKSRDRMFDDQALRAIWRVLTRAEHGITELGDPGTRLASTTAMALRFALLTLARRGEVAGARWSEVDLSERKWTVPAERAKAIRAHTIPLSETALDLLTAARTLRREGDHDFIFPAPRDPAKSLSPDALTRALTRLCEQQGIPHGTPHDFRRSGATTLTGERYGIRRFIVSKVLGHSASDGGALVTEVYDRNSYLIDKRRALDAWARHLTQEEGGAGQADRIVALPKRAAP